MADERNRWLDRAAAERLLRGEPAVPGADHDARVRAERLRAALGELAGPPHAGAELPGEAAALAAFRAARGEAPAARAAAAAFGSGEPVVELSPRSLAAVHEAAAASGSASGSASEPGTRRVRRIRPVRFGLAAALASVAFGGLAAAAGAGLLDGTRHDSAGPAPAVSVSSGDSPAPGDGEGPYPTLTPQFRPSEPRVGDGSATPGAQSTPGADGRTTPEAGTAIGGGSGGSGGTGTEPSANGAATTGKDTGGKEHFLGGGETLKDRETRLRAVNLCEYYRAGRLNDDRREKLARLAGGREQIPRYCEKVIDGVSDGGTKGSTPGAPGVEPGRTDGGGGVLRAPKLTTAPPVNGSAALLTR
ncbi:hypothetical protein [Streptomyces sp. NPDC048340]|uniref:hypothetical protein n=1 Tax=Streptomyces sp. NPDC048340 TaxID=3365537 RepID=UPI0037238FF7